MDYEDRITIGTPEGVTLRLTLGGLGSRLVAALIDSVIKGVAFVVLFMAATILAALLPPGAAALAIMAWASLVAFLLFFVYDVVFETLASGRTPGKRAAGLRVVREGGSPVGFRASAVRNILRLVDLLPGFYLVGILSILLTSQNQRVGDLAAGTLVVRERRGKKPLAPGGEGLHLPEEELAGWDVSAVTAEEIQAVRRYLERRAELTPEARRHLAEELAGRLRPKVVHPPLRLDAEAFLRRLAAAKGDRS